jgi:hypothetical protein
MTRDQLGHTFELSPRFSCDEIGIAGANRDSISNPQQVLPLAKVAVKAIAIEFDLKGPLLARGQRRAGLALHRLKEGRFRALLNCFVLRRLCLR